jgi:hypothetical protein
MPQQDRVSVRRTPRDLPSTKSASRSGALVNDELLSDGFGKLVSQYTGDNSGAAAWSKGIDDGDRPRRIGLRLRDVRECRQHGSARGRCNNSYGVLTRFRLTPT